MGNRNGGNKMRAVIYIRGNDSSFQEKRCLDYALSKSYDVLAVTNDIRDITIPIISGEVDIVVSVGVSRITRDYAKFKRFQNILIKHGVFIDTVDSGFILTGF